MVAVYSITLELFYQHLWNGGMEILSGDLLWAVPEGQL